VRLVKQKYEITETDIPGEHKIYVWNYLVARKLNRLLNFYEDYMFQDGDEAIFYVPADKLNEVKALLGIKL
jgi:hypothetical protein